MSIRKSSTFSIALTATWGMLFLFMIRATAESGERAKADAIQKVARYREITSAAAFESLVPVLHHPRCMNCHSSGDYPRQGDDSHRHIMLIRRGPDGQGVDAVKCSSCHLNRNIEGPHMPPGAPDWHLPSAAMPMIWQGLTDHQLCELFKDPKQNGNRTVGQIVEHMHTPLVLWGWNPGGSRVPIPMPQHEFLVRVREWASKGAACPVEAGAGGSFESESRTRLSIGNENR